jgi:trehalose 6-phosphate synthase
VAAQDADDPGVLILSQFTGAAEEMREALIVNPYNIEESAEAIRTALEMKLDERRARYESLMAAVCKHDVRSWYQSFRAELERVRSAEDPSRWGSPEPIRAALEKLEGVTGPRPPSTARERDRLSSTAGDRASEYGALALKSCQ